MEPTDPPTIPPWRDIRATTEGLQQAMDAMIEQADFASFRPSVARAIAQARDEKQRADHPLPALPRMVGLDDTARLEAIAIDLAPHDIARILLAGRA
ncbi:MAG: hypothetical protein GYA24_06155 [Candidatus Lokiarchaeota archaeon]|nr:hypothetical protein [Candidatus Lokiarchaeota archaeon]